MKIDPTYVVIGLLLVAITGAALASSVAGEEAKVVPIKRKVNKLPNLSKPVENKVVKKEETKEAVQDVVNIPGETPEQAFPAMQVPKDAEEELAQAYTYNNLQESMLNEAMDLKRNIRSRPAFSRLGDRANSESWQTQLREVRQQIRSSGQSLREFVDSSWTPIPEQLASVWESEEEASAIPEVRSQVRKTMSREALAEAAFLTREAMQEISIRDPKEAKARMQEVYDARLRAKSLGLNIPGLSDDQKRALEVWKSVEPELVKSLSLL